MNYRDWKNGTYQNYNDPTEYIPIIRYCEICNIEEERTYFVEDTCICEDCYKEEEEETNENNN